MLNVSASQESSAVAYSFSDIHKAEIKRIASSNPKAPPPPKSTQNTDHSRREPQTVHASAHFPNRLINKWEIGLAISGGGVRSATFGLGVLQGLAQSSQHLLDRLGYTSSVSGGSYINCWLCSLIAKGGFSKVRDMLREHLVVSDTNAQLQRARHQLLGPLTHLRQYSSYLTPARGLLSSDTWNIVGAYLLRLVPNAAFVFLAAIAIILLPYLLMDLSHYELDWIPHWRWYWGANLVIAMSVYGFYFGRLNLDDVRGSKRLADQTAASFALAGILITPYLIRLSEFSISAQLAWIAFIILSAQVAFLIKTLSCRPTTIAQLKCFPLGTISGTASWLLVLKLSRVGPLILTNRSATLLSLRLQIALMPLAVALVYLVVASVYLFLIRYEDESQEWLNLVWGATMKWSCLWFAICFIALIAPTMWQSWSGALHVWQGVMAILIWLVLSSASVHSAFSGKAGVFGNAGSDAGATRTKAKRHAASKRVAGVFAATGPTIVICGGLILLALASEATCNYLFPDQLSAIYSVPSTETRNWAVVFQLSVFTLAFGLAWLIANQMDVNRLSMHNIYRFRLAKCYLGAGDFIDIHNEADREWFSSHSSVSIPLGKIGFQGPYPLINAALNVTKQGSLELQKRKAVNFIFSPLFCGFHREPIPSQFAGSHVGKGRLDSCAYRPTEQYLSIRKRLLRMGRSQTKVDGSQILLSEAMAISGAAQSPNQGSHTSSSVAVLLTMANVRLGAWVGNPRSIDGWRSYPSVGAGRLLINEMGGNADDEQKEVYLSDGGHFENMGLYELVRRKCRIIICSDADCDPNYNFDDLLVAMERCHVDFGAKIDIDIQLLKQVAKIQYSKCPYVVGRIKYANDPECGALVVVKPVVTEDAWEVTKRFDSKQSHFPHEPTTNQWFDEEQFEAYRSIGESAIQRFSKDLDKGECPPFCDAEAWSFLCSQLCLSK